MYRRGALARPEWLAWPVVIRGAVLFAAYVVAAGGSLLYLRYGASTPALLEVVAIPWLAAGIAVAGIMLGGERLWPAVFLASWTVWGVLRTSSPGLVTLDAAAEAFTTILTVRLLGSWGFHRELDRIRDPLILLAAAAVGRAIAALIDDAGVFATAWLAPGTLRPDYRDLLTGADGAMPAITTQLVASNLRWMLDGIAGVVLVIPAVVASPQPVKRAARERPAAFAAWIALSAFLALSAVALSHPALRIVLVVGALALIIWAALDFGLMATALVSVLFVAAGVYRIGADYFKNAQHSAADPVSTLWGFVALVSLTGLMTITLMAERRRDLVRLSAVADRYRRLFRATPAALFVADSATGRILQANDAAVLQYGYSESELKALSVMQLAATGEDAPMPDLPVGAEIIALPTVKHRTKTGAFIDVELTSTPVELAGQRAKLWHALDVTSRIDLRLRLLNASDLERRRLARELHDGLGQALTGLSLGAHSLLARARRTGAVDGDSLAFVDKARQEAVKLLADVTAGASPLDAADGDLREALRRLPDSLPPETRARVRVTIAEHAPLRLSVERTEHLYRLAQEALNNALKHARAEIIELVMDIREDRVALAVKDDGVGMSAAKSRADGGLGLHSMNARAAAASADLTVSARPEGGTEVLCECSQDLDEAATPVATLASAAAASWIAAGSDRAVLLRATPEVWRTVARCVLVAAACAAGTLLTVTLASLSDPRLGMTGARLAVPSLMAGAGAAGLVLGGPRLWPGVFAGVLIAYGAIEKLPWAFGALAAGAAVLGSLIVVALLRMWKFSRPFDRWQDPLALAGAAAIGWACAESLTCMLLLAYAGLRPGSLGHAFTSLLTAPSGEYPVVTGSFLAAALRWWADTTAGVVLVVPTVAAIPPIWRAAHDHAAEFGVWALAAAGWTVLLLTLPHTGPIVFVFGALLLVTWAALRVGVALATAATMYAAMAIAVGFAAHRGAMATIGVEAAVVQLWSILILLTLMGFFIASLLAERDRARREIVSAGSLYRGLFASSPQPLLLCGGDGRIRIVNERAVRTYGYSAAEFSHKRVEQLAAIPTPPLRLDGNVRSRPERDAMRHRTKSGEVIDVELSSISIDLDDGPAHLWFVQDVTERNRLRRAAIEATDRERHRIATDLEVRLGRCLREVGASAKLLNGARSDAEAVVPLAQQLAATAQQAAGLCRQISHRVSASDLERKDLATAVQDIRDRLPESLGARLEVRIASEAEAGMPVVHREHFVEIIREGVLFVSACGFDNAIVVDLEITPDVVRATVDGRSNGSLPDRRMLSRPPATATLRAGALGFLLWADTVAGDRAKLVCEWSPRRSA